MRNVSLKVLEKSLKFLFKKGYEPCLGSPELKSTAMLVNSPTGDCLLPVGDF